MNFPTILGVILVALGILVVYQNPEPYAISLIYIEIRASVGVMWVSTLGLGILTGVVAMMTRDIPRMRRLRTLNVEE